MSSCRHTAPLLSVLRYGEIDEASDRHVAHLEFCGTCQSALIDDGALTRQLERALRDRIVGATPSPDAWRALRDRITAEPVRWQTRLTRWLRVPAGGLASAGAIAAVAVVLAVSGAPAQPGATGQSTAADVSSPATLPIRSTPLGGMARVPAEAVNAPAPPDLSSVVMQAKYARPTKSPERDVVLAAFIGKASPPSVDSVPEGYELVAYQPDTDPE